MLINWLFMLLVVNDTSRMKRLLFLINPSISSRCILLYTTLYTTNSYNESV